nr:ribonuclease H [Tanacetum cinerariifolium]
TRSDSKANVSEGLSKPVTAYTLPHTAKKAVSNTNVPKPGMYRIDNRIAHTRVPQLPQTVRNTNPRVSSSTGVNHNTNLKEVKRIFRYLRDTVNMGLWYPKDSSFELTAFSDADHASAIAISCNPVQHFRTKHIHTRYHFIKEQVKNGIIELYFVRTEYQLADMFTKALPEERFKYLVRRISMRCLTPAELEVLANESA